MMAVLPDQPQVTDSRCCRHPSARARPLAEPSPAPATPGTPGEEAQLFSLWMHQYFPGCLPDQALQKHPGVALCWVQRCLQLKAAPRGRSPVPSGRQLPAALTRRRAPCCGTAAGTEPPGSPRPAGGSRASPRSRAVPRAAQSHSTACCPPAAPSLPFRVLFPKFVSCSCFVFVNQSPHTPKAPSPSLFEDQ